MIQYKFIKELYYGNEAADVADCKSALQKLVGKHYQNFCIFAFRQPHPDDDFFTFRNFTRKDSLSDTVNLQEFIPLDVNEYRISIGLNYYSKDGIRIINSEFITYNVNFKPKGSIFD
jgi:hypothetical protein